jgi:hypothetical protein
MARHLGEIDGLFSAAGWASVSRCRNPLATHASNGLMSLKAARKRRSQTGYAAKQESAMTPAELLAEARLYLEASHRETKAEMKYRLTDHALTLAQLAEKVERERFAIEANIERFEQLLRNGLDDGPRKQLDALLAEECAKLAALTAGGQQGYVAAWSDQLLDEAIAMMNADMGDGLFANCCQPWF